jgi:hypothetical protein
MSDALCAIGQPSKGEVPSAYEAPSASSSPAFGPLSLRPRNASATLAGRDGGAIPRLFVREGYVACVTRRDAERLELVLAEIRRFASEAHGYGSDAPAMKARG